MWINISLNGDDCIQPDKILKYIFFKNADDVDDNDNNNNNLLIIKGQ
jgi:hypothetical protein